jgi:alpha-galactosidase
MYSKIKCIGLCHGIFSVAGRIAPIFNRPPEGFELYAAGMNHFQWILAIRDRQTGEDLYPLFRKLENDYDPSYMPYSRKMFHFFGLFPTCSDDHLGEYQAYGYEAGEHGYDFDADEQERIRRKKEIAEVVAGSRDPSPWLKPSEEQAINVLTSIYFNKRRNIPSAIICNGGTIPQLPADVAVEVPVTVDGNGVHPWMVPDLPSGPIGALYMQVSAQRLSVQAAALGSKKLALQTLLCDPVINSTDSAVKIVDDLFEINKQYIRKCI